MGALPGEHGEDSGEEELVAGGWSQRPVRFILLAVVLLVAAVLVYALTRGHSFSSTARHTRHTAPQTSGRPSVSANAVLVPGLSTGSRVTGADRLISYTAELINLSPDPLTISDPIRVTGARRAPVTVLYVEVAGPDAGMNGLRPQPLLTRIAGHEHVVLWLGVQVQCAHWAGRERWPSAGSRIAIPLAGFPTPATFGVAELFGPGSPAHPNGVCAPHPRS